MVEFIEALNQTPIKRLIIYVITHIVTMVLVCSAISDIFSRNREEE